MRRPLVLVALLYAAGLLLAEIAPPSLPWLFGCGFGLAALALVWPRVRAALLVPLIIIVGWTNLTTRTAILSPQDLRNQLATTPADSALRGTLCDTPSVRMFMRDEQESIRTLALIEVTALRHGTNWIPAHGRVLTVTPASLDGLMFGHTEIEVSGIIAPPSRPVAPGLFDYQAYLARQGIYFHLKADSTNSWRVLGEAKPALADRFLTWAQRTLALGLPAEDKELRLLWAMTLGWKTGLTSEVYEPFMQSGTMHIFAISGLHIALIAGILVALLRVLRIPRRWCGVVVIPLIWFYTAATGWQPSAIRSVIMMTVIIGGWSLGRPSDLLNSLATAALIILVWDPPQLFQASFQLSFFVVLSIALLLPPLTKLRNKLLAHDPLLPRELLPRWRRLSESLLLRPITTSANTSLAAWIGALPLTAYYFHIFSPVTLLANLVIVPLSSLTLARNLGSLLCGAWFPAVSELFNHSAWLWMHWMVKLSEYSTKIPGAFRYVAAPDTVDFAIYYGLTLLLLSRVLFKPNSAIEMGSLTTAGPVFRMLAENRGTCEKVLDVEFAHRCVLRTSEFEFKPGGRIWLVGLLAATAAFYGWRWQDSRNAVYLTVLPLNGAGGVFANHASDAGPLLIDCGNTNAVAFITKPFLRAQGVNRLPQLALTHGDLRAIGGALELSAEFGNPEIVTSPVRFRSRTYRDIVSKSDTAPLSHQIVQANNAFAGWQVLHPEPGKPFAQADDNALVLRGEFHSVRVLLLSDLGLLGQDALASRTSDLRADIVVTGLPEKSEPLTTHFLAAVQPRLIIVTDTEFPATKRASPALVQRLRQSQIPVLYTRHCGAVEIVIRNANWIVRTMDGFEQQWPNPARGK